MKRNRIAALILLSAVFIITAAVVFTGAAAELELQAHKLINPNGSTNMFFKFFTDIGEAPGVIGVILIFILIPKTRMKIGVPTAVTVASSYIVSRIIKEIVSRQRPAQRLLEIGGYSFPSGHAANNAALYITIMLLAAALCKNTKQKAAIFSVCIIIPFIIGLSRVYFNVHYLSDVICGWCLGGIFAIVFTEIYFHLCRKKLCVRSD